MLHHAGQSFKDLINARSFGVTVEISAPPCRLNSTDNNELVAEKSRQQPASDPCELGRLWPEIRLSHLTPPIWTSNDEARMDIVIEVHLLCHQQGEIGKAANRWRQARHNLDNFHLDDQGPTGRRKK
jgi:hypothetical protein